MKVVALISGGKDSCFNMMQCVAEGHDLVALANLRPKQEDELDSYMFQTVGHHAIELYAEAMQLPMYRGYIEGSSKEQGGDYLPTEGDEVEDLFALLKNVKSDLGVEGVSVGAILSNYQRVRVENVCSRLALTPLAFLWRRDQDELLQEMITAGVEAIIIKVAALGLTSNHLRKTLQEIQPHMLRMREKYQLNVCGEGGEFETFTLDCPLFANRMIVKHAEVVNHSDDAFASVHYLNLLSMELEEKQNIEKTFADRLRNIPMKRGSDIHKELACHMIEASPEADLCTRHQDNPGQDSNHDPNTDSVAPLCRVSSEGYLWLSGVTVSQSDGITEGMQHAMQSIQELFGNHGYNLSDAVLIHLYLKDMSSYSQFNSVYCKYFQQNPPARVCVEVNLPDDVAVQIDCLAHSNHSNKALNPEPVPRHTMHVQSISHWAPANIGPYSQAVQIGDLIFTAGTIGLCPSTMRTIEGGIAPQCALSLCSLKRVLSAMEEGVSLSDVIGGVCYVTDVRHLNTARDYWENYIHTHEDSCTVVAQSMMCYVVVPRLPKDVLVEWHVVARPHSQSQQYSSQTVRGHVSSTEIRMVLDEGGSSGFMVCDVTADSQPEPELTVRDLLAAVGARMKEQTYSWNGALSMRVFYRQSFTGHGQLSRALNAECEKISLTCPAVCLAPVLALPGSCVITVLIFLQR